jgi:hypothetical protein|nr:MAG TPA: hypothetical protein [Caudoviricetes sp.]DAU01427.1 MAG TPA: hypothetical protein [Caudoviricetes sp.]
MTPEQETALIDAVNSANAAIAAVNSKIAGLEAKFEGLSAGVGGVKKDLAALSEKTDDDADLINFKLTRLNRERAIR